MRVLAALLLAVVALSATAVSANTCAVRTSSNADVYDQALAICQNQNGCTFGRIQNAQNSYYQTYMMCSPNPANPGAGTCCVDECYTRTVPTCMTDDKICTLIPGPGVSKTCITRGKICAGINPGVATNSSSCTRFPFCAWENNACVFTLPENPQVPPGASVADKCPALHPVVVAMLALMFITFVGAVVLVAVVVYRNQKKFDEDEERRAQAQAAAAEAKRSRSARNKL